MKIAVIGRTETLYKTAELLHSLHYSVPIIITAKEAPEYTKTSKDYQDLAQKLGAKFILTTSIKKYIQEIKESSCDIAVSMNYPTLIPNEVIDLFPLGILNAHGGDLPKYRGNACQAWAILNGESKIGLCIHKMKGNELDSGDIIEREYISVTINTKVTECWEWMNKRIPDMFVSAIQKLEKDPDYVLEKQSENPKDALRCYPRFPEDGKIDWNKSSVEILRLINASNKPYAGAFCNYQDKKIIIWDAELYPDEENYLAVPGQISEIKENGSVVVITGMGKLILHRIEYDGNLCKPGQIIRSIRSRLK